MKRQQGFTLIELLVVVAIIGILGAIAIQQFAEYKQNSHNAMARSDLRNGITAEEAYFSENEDYISCTDPLTCEAALSGFIASRGSNGNTSITPFSFTSASNSFTATAAHPNGSKTYTFDSSLGTMSEN